MYTNQPIVTIPVRNIKLSENFEIAQKNKKTTSTTTSAIPTIPSHRMGDEEDSFSETSRCKGDEEVGKNDNLQNSGISVLPTEVEPSRQMKDAAICALAAGRGEGITIIISCVSFQKIQMCHDMSNLSHAIFQQ